MFGEDKNFKDAQKDSFKDISSAPVSYEATGLHSGSYSNSKTNKLITALFMVTDIIDKDEPLRNKLRTLGIKVISDMHSTPTKVCGRIAEIMSFLDIASAVSIISPMNCNILRKEFLELNRSVNESANKVRTFNGQIDLTDFFTEQLPAPVSLKDTGVQPKGHYQSIGQLRSTRIGVQKGSTLLKALSEKTAGLAGNRPKNTGSVNFDILKKQRRDEIIIFINKNGEGATITDIKNGAGGLPAGRQGVLVSCGEKTLQRELISMVKDGVLNKTGEKRWSRYFVK